jgi:hypothetical protein
MTVREVSGTDVTYHLVCFDKEGKERPEGDGTFTSDALRSLVGGNGADGPVTDVFFLSHGWQGDIPAAIDQYDRWVRAMAQQTDDRKAARLRYPGFRALIVGLHWPSKPWGDERLLPPPASGLLSDDAGAAAAASIDGMIDVWADRLADTPAARAALGTILRSAGRDEEADSLPDDVCKAYEILRVEAGLTRDGDMMPPAAAGSEAWDPRAVYGEMRGADHDGFAGLLGGGTGNTAPFDNILTPLRQLSFWKMKDRARSFGETGAADMLRLLQGAAPESTRFHLMGHSFGCIVVSAALAGHRAERTPAAGQFNGFGSRGAVTVGIRPGRTGRPRNERVLPPHYRPTLGQRTDYHDPVFTRYGRRQILSVGRQDGLPVPARRPAQIRRYRNLRNPGLGCTHRCSAYRPARL